MKMFHITALIAAISLSLGASSVFAQDTPSANSNCGRSGSENWRAVRESLVGNWEITHHSDYALAGTMMIPFPGDGQAGMVTIALIDDVLELSHPEMQAPMVLHLADEPAWTMHNDNPAIPTPTLTALHNLVRSIDVKY